MMDAEQLRLVARLLGARSIEELVATTERTPEALRPEFEAVVTEMVQLAVTNGESAMAVALEQLAQVLRAIRGMPMPERDAGLFELLTGTPLDGPLTELADLGDWNGWQAFLRRRPELIADGLVDYLARIRDYVHEQDLWVLDALSEFLACCRAAGPEAAVEHWRSSAHVGDGAQLPAEYQIMAMSHVVDRIGAQDDLHGARALGILGRLLSRRQLGARRENLRRSERLLRTAAARAAAHGDIRLRAECQQALVNVLLEVDGKANAAPALELCQAALKGWQAGDDPELWGLITTSRANCLVTLGRSDEAIEAYQASLTVFTRSESPNRWAISTFGLAGAHLYRGLHGGDSSDFEHGLVLLKEAAQLRTREVDEVRWAMTQDGLGWCYLYRLRAAERAEDVQRAVEHFSAALEFYSPGRPERPHTQNGLGQAYFARYEQAGDRADLLASQAALTEALEVTGADERRDVHHRLARIALRQAATDPAARDAARQHQLAALALVSAEDDPDGWAAEVISHAQALTEGAGQPAGEGYEQAIRFLTDALATTSGAARARILAALGTAYGGRPFNDSRENHAQATECFREGLAEITKDGDPKLWSTLQLCMAALMLDHEPGHSYDEEARDARYAEALSHLNEALTTGPPSPRDVAVIKSLIGEAHLTYGHRCEATAPLEEARHEFRRLGQVTELACVQLQLARAYGATEARAIRAAETARRLTPLVLSPRNFGAASEWLAHAHLERGEFARAGHAFHDAVRARNAALHSAWLPTDQATVRGWFRGNIAEQACLAFARAAEQASDQEERARLLALAVESADAGRMRGFTEFDPSQMNELARHEPELHRELQESVAHVQAAARVDRASLTGALAGPLAVIPDTGIWLADREEARASRSRYAEVLARIRVRTGLNLVDEPLSLPEIAVLLGSEDALAYVLSDDGVFGTDRQLVLLVNPDATVWMHWTSGAAREFYDVATWLPNQSIARLTQGAGDGGFVGRLRQALDAALPAAARQLCGPLGKALRDTRISRVFLVTCGILGHFPLHACAVDAEGQVALGEEFDVSYVPSAAVLRALRARSGRARRRLAVTVTNPLPHPQPLPFAAAQQAEIAAAARAGGIALVELAEHAATGAAVRAAVAGATYVDFACHGRLDQGHPLDSGLLLSDEELVLRDVLDTRLLDGVSLVTLTACQSAVASGSPFDDEPVTLATGFLAAGAHSVLGTLWLVDDLATALVAGRFYRHHLVDGLPLATALGRAQQWLRRLTLADVAAELGEAPGDPLYQAVRPFEHPLYWAPYVLTSG